MNFAYNWDIRSEPRLRDEHLVESKAMIGMKLRRSCFNHEASRIAIVRFARGIGDRNRLWLDEEYGKGTMWGCMIAPPTWLYSVDNTVVAPKLRGIHSVYVGAEWEFERPVRVGDKIVADAMLIGTEEKKGTFCGRMIMQIGEVLYKNQRDEVVGKCRSKVMRCPRGEAKARSKYLNTRKYRYSPNELEKIGKIYEEEKVGGGEVLYWEDVAVGDSIGVIVRGPLTAEDMFCFINATMPIRPFALAHRHRRRHPADFYFNPETNLADFSAACIIDDTMARECGFPFAHDTGIQRVAFCANLLTNWMGDNAWLKYLNIDLLLPFFYGDTIVCKGDVAGKQIKNNEHLVRCDVSGENQWGECVVKGTAITRLVSRSM